MLPSGMKLMVKEHRFNWGRRYVDYLLYLNGLPNVVLINPFDTQFKYINNAALVITDNGSTGWEGVLLKKKVLTLDTTFYNPVRLAKMVTEITHLDRHILESLHAPSCQEEEYDRVLGLFIDATNESTLAIDEMHENLDLSMQYIEKLLKQQTVN